MPENQKIGEFHARIVFPGKHYVAAIQMTVGERTTHVRGIPVRESHEQQDLYNYVSEELGWWIEAVATTVTADRQARADQLAVDRLG